MRLRRSVAVGPHEEQIPVALLGTSRENDPSFGVHFRGQLRNFRDSSPRTEAPSMASADMTAETWTSWSCDSESVLRLTTGQGVPMSSIVMTSCTVFVIVVAKVDADIVAAVSLS